MFERLECVVMFSGIGSRAQNTIPPCRRPEPRHSNSADRLLQVPRHPPYLGDYHNPKASKASTAHILAVVLSMTLNMTFLLLVLFTGC